MSNWSLPLARFQMAMAERLDANEHKRGWTECTPKWLLHRLRQETDELEKAMETGKDVTHEAADVANFAMMIADTLEGNP